MFGVRLARFLVLISTVLLSVTSFSQSNEPTVPEADIEATIKALRISAQITGGTLPTTDPAFSEMVSKIKAGKSEEAALVAAKSKYFAFYLARRLALQMQSASLDAANGKDNDATAFLVAHFVGAGNGSFQPKISDIWSENATYKVNVNRSGVVTQVSASDLTEAEKFSVDWRNALVRIPGQTVKWPTNLSVNMSATTPLAYDSMTLPDKHVGGYVTLSSRGEGEGSLAEHGAKAGTNLRYIEGVWIVATGLELMEVASSDASVSVVPRFIPQNDKNFEIGTGQVACLSCHGGGYPSLNHGYSTLADTFNFDPNVGLVFFQNNVTVHRKSLGSDPVKRADALKCDLTKTPQATCAPGSLGADPNQGWNVSETWARTGVLEKMGWRPGAPTSGQGFNELGKAIGQSRIVYERMTKRVMNEICPLGIFRKSDLDGIVNQVYPFISPVGSNVGTDDIRTIVAKVAIHESCM